MTKTNFMDKYPVYTVELSKNELAVTTVDEIIESLKSEIEAHPIAAYIAIFDHYSHTKKIDGDMVEGLEDVKNIVFCFGAAIPATKMVAVRPRSIGVCDMGDKIVFEFLDAPKEELNSVMEKWIKNLKK